MRLVYHTVLSSGQLNSCPRRLTHNHPGQLVRVALPSEGVILPHLEIPAINVSVVAPRVDIGLVVVFLHPQALGQVTVMIRRGLLGCFCPGN